MTKRQGIIDELENRLKTALSDISIQRGFGQPIPKDYPSIFIIEGVEKVTEPSLGMYSRDLLALIHYFIQSDEETMYEDANTALIDIQEAVDIDYDFAGLSINYGIIETQIIPQGDRAVIITAYHFRFLEQKILD